MKTTRVFSSTLKAYNQGYRIIANKGGSRSSKTFSELQLFYTIAKNSKKKRVISIVSHSLPHLEGGAIRDFDNILESDRLIPDDIRTKKPYIYKINKTIIEFIGFDRPGKALGAARDILFVNECNKMTHSIVHQLIQRTRECVFLDWNPSEDFWFDIEGYENRRDCIVITSNFFDNIINITPGQLTEFKEAKEKALKEDRAGKRGYWWNWWQVYGLGKKGQVEGVIFQNWQTYSELPDDVDLYRLQVVDWGGSEPTVLCEVWFDGDNSRMYVKEHIYKPTVLNSKIIEYIQSLEKCTVVVDSARKDKKDELIFAGINAIGATKGAGSIMDGLERMQEFSIFVHEDSNNVIDEFRKYKRVQDKVTGKYLDEPEDKNNHAIDAIRYGTRFYRKYIKPLK